MLADGGVLTPTGNADLILLQRTRFFLFMAQGLSCTILPGITFRDSKVSFLFSPSRLTHVVTPRSRRSFSSNDSTLRLTRSSEPLSGNTSRRSMTTLRPATGTRESACFRHHVGQAVRKESRASCPSLRLPYRLPIPLLPSAYTLSPPICSSFPISPYTNAADSMRPSTPTYTSCSSASSKPQSSRPPRSPPATARSTFSTSRPPRMTYASRYKRRGAL